jgi:hypothetical protein
MIVANLFLKVIQHKYGPVMININRSQKRDLNKMDKYIYHENESCQWL